MPGASWVSLARTVRSASGVETLAIRTDAQFYMQFEQLKGGQGVLQLTLHPKALNWIKGTAVVLDPKAPKKSEHGTNSNTRKTGRKLKPERQEDRELVKRLKANVEVERSQRQEQALKEMDKELAKLSGSTALSEHLIKCGVCLSVRKICAADRNNEGRIKYFRQKHYDNCVSKNPGLLQERAIHDKELRGMKGIMAAFLRSPSENTSQIVADDIGLDEKDEDLIPGNEAESDLYFMQNNADADMIDLDLVEDDDSECVVCQRLNPESALGNMDMDFSENVQWYDNDSEYDTECDPVGITYYEPDQLTLKLQNVIDLGKLPKTSFMYIFLQHVLDHALSDRCQTDFEWNKEVLEFFNTLQYLGGEKVANFVRGPMNTGMGRGGIHDFTFANANLGGPSAFARAKIKSGYTTDSGVHKVLVKTLHSLTKKTLSALIDDVHVKSVPVSVASDGTALKPAIEFDSRQKANVGLDEAVSIEFVRSHPELPPEQLKNRFVTEALVTFATDLSNTVSLPFAVDYMTACGKTKEKKKGAIIESH